MARHARTDINGVLLEHGFVDYGAGQLTVVDDFNLTPYQWKWNGAAWVSFTPAPTPQQVAAGKIANGIAITSTGTPALNSTYAIDPVSQQHVASVSTYISVNAKFPAAQTTLNWHDINGVIHAFQTTAQFQAFATACADVVYQIVQGGSPTQSGTIP